MNLENLPKVLKNSNIYMEIAELTSTLSTCVKKQVGAVLISNGRIISTGYNGAPSGITHCTKKSCLRNDLADNEKPEICRAVHAEVNCIIQCAIHGTKIEKPSLIFSTYFPCMSCAKIIVNAKINYIIFKNDYEMNNLEKMRILDESLIQIYKFEQKIDSLNHHYKWGLVKFVPKI